MPLWRRHSHRMRSFDGMQAFYVNASLRALVFALVGIFLPIFVYRSVLVEHTSMTSLLAVALFFLILRGVVLLTILPLSRVVERLGFRWSVLVSVFLLFLSFVGLYLADGGSLWWLWLSAVLLGLQVPFYWVSRHSVVVIDSKRDGVGKQVGFLAVLERASGILGPVAGGLLIETWGFHALYGSALVLLVFSVVPLFYMPHHIHRNGVSISGFFRWIRDRQFFHQALGAVGRGVDDYGGQFLWPLVVSFMGIGIATLGVVFSALSVLSTIVRYISGVFFDRLFAKRGLEDEWLFGISSLLTSVVWMVRLFITNVTQVLLVDGTLGMAGTVYRNVSDDYFYLGGKRMSEIAYVAYREMLLSLAIIFLLLVMIVSILVGLWPGMVFLVISLWVLVSIVQARESNL